MSKQISKLFKIPNGSLTTSSFSLCYDMRLCRLLRFMTQLRYYNYRLVGLLLQVTTYKTDMLHSILHSLLAYLFTYFVRKLKSGPDAIAGYHLFVSLFTLDQLDI